VKDRRALYTPVDRSRPLANLSLFEILNPTFATFATLRLRALALIPRLAVFAVFALKSPFKKIKRRIRKTPGLSFAKRVK
jgi:hypothetical protein